MRRTKPIALVTGLALMLTQVVATERVFAATSLNGHAVMTDSAGRIVPWTSDPTAGYGIVIDKAWDYLLNRVPNDPATGKPAYYSQSYLDPDTQQVAHWPHNPAGLYSMLVESALKYYAYSGDIRPVNLAKQVASWQITNGMTGSSDNWARVPYASGDAGSLLYRGASYGDRSGTGDGTGYIQPDKVGAMGYAWAQLFEFDGTTDFRDAAISAADALAKHARTGNALQSPWPFRVNAATGAVREDYSANVIEPIQLFDMLISLGVGDTTAYRSARQVAWNWLMAYPMTNNRWANYFEDIMIQPGIGNDNQYSPMMTARYMLTHPDADPNWRNHVQDLISWVENHFSAEDSGATIIKEQVEFPFAMGSHTSRYASVNALYSTATGDAAAKTKALYSLNWATYMTRDNGVVIDGPQVNDQWFTDGYGDYIRHFLTSMQAFPEWAPSGQNHLTGSTSLVRNVSYASSSINYTTADTSSTESLRVNFRPAQVVVAGRSMPLRTDLAQEGWTYDSATQVVRIRHDSGASVQISSAGGSPGGSTNVAPTVALTWPASGSTAVEAGSTIQLAATASDADGTVASVQFLNGNQPLTTVTRTPYIFQWTPTTPGTYALSAVATDDDGATGRTATVSITVTAADAPDPTDWSSSDIGSVGVAGSWSVKDGVYTVSGSGVDIWNAADSFRFVYQPLAGDGEIIARVDTQGTTDPWALSGVMIRESLSDSSTHAIAANTPGHGLSLTSRSQPGAMSQYINGGLGTPPQWLRLTRTGSQFTAFESDDGSQWTALGSVALQMGSTAYIGLAVTSHNNLVLMTSTFSNVRVNGAGDTTAPIITGVAVGNANQNGASVTWTTDEPADSQIEYGTSASYGMSTALNSSLVTSHSIVVSGLDSATTYRFRVKSRDAAGNLATGADGVFTMPGIVETSSVSSTQPESPTTEPSPPPTTTPTSQTSSSITSTPMTSTTQPTDPTSTSTSRTTTTTAAPAPASDDVRLRARANSKYVTAENAGSAPLIANRTVIGVWERFDLVDLGAGKVALLAHANRKYVCADNVGATSLIANRTAVGPWETFILVRNPDGTASMKAQANGMYVTAESAGAAPLIANRAAIGPWERFDLIEG